MLLPTAVLAAVLGVAVCQQPPPDLAPALEEDEACAAAGSGEGGPCALSLRHLRTQRKVLEASAGTARGGSAGGAASSDRSSPRRLRRRVELLSWDEAYEQAEDLLRYMEPSDKSALLRGIGWAPVNGSADLQKWWYVGNTPGIPRLGIPSLNMQDAAGGFRTYWPFLVGTVTCWPSLLSMAATWNPEAVREYAVSLGEEFGGKAANGILGPSIAVQRVARGGRNFEYLSGEDPYLGSKLAEAYVDGVQSQGVLAVMKHWVFNNQETNRMTESSIVDEKTAFELYYPPYQAAVDAGVSAAMCSYNKVNGTYSCQNSHSLMTVLKEKFGFRGFVQSDWWALHSNASLAMGLDQDMPGWPVELYFFEGFPSTNQLAVESPGAVDDAVRRILAVMFRMKLRESTKCAPPHCRQWFEKNVTGPEHAALARRLAAESIVLLKNEKNVLPLSNGQGVRTIAVIGSAAVAQPYDPAGAGQGNAGWGGGDYYSGGGSGHVVAGYVVTPLEGIRARAAGAGISVIESTTDEEHSAVEAAKASDVAIVVAATTSGEMVDRHDLDLDGGANSLIAAVAAHARRTVVIMQIPGAVVMPWRDSVAAILALFLGGQETGSAWADVLFGDHAPTGRLPLMLPATEADTIPPSTSLNITYSEGLATSYRNPNFKAAFPFGHGLTYTSFSYLSAERAACPEGEALVCVKASVLNSGSVAGQTVVQLYLELPPVAGWPAPVLKGFQSTGLLAPGKSVEVSFALTQRDLSYFDPDSSSWTLATSATAHMGESSGDIRHSVPFSVPQPGQA